MGGVGVAPAALPQPSGLGLFAACISVAAGSGSPTWWRLICGDATTSEWHMCDVRFYHDRYCAKAPAAPLVVAPLVAHYSSATRVEGRSFSVPTIYDQWASACTSCLPEEAYLGARFSEALVLQCVAFAECNPPTGNSISCERLHLQSGEGSTFGEVSWSLVAEWLSPQPNYALSLNTATPESRPVPGDRVVDSVSPPSSSCAVCGTFGIEPDEHLRFTFDYPIFVGDENVRIERGGLGTLSVYPSDTNWFHISGPTVELIPQESLAASGACVTIDLAGLTFVDSDGHGPEYGESYSWCVVDYVSPELQNTVFVTGASSTSAVPMDPTPTFEFSFTELVQITGTETIATIVPQASTSNATTVTVSLVGGDTTLSTWGTYNTKSHMRVKVRDLAPLTTYSFTITSHAITDKAGNIWGGTTFPFTTLESASSSTTLDPVAEDSTTHSQALSETVLFAVLIGIAATLLLLTAASVVQCIRKRRVTRTAEQDRHDFVEHKYRTPTATWETGGYFTHTYSRASSTKTKVQATMSATKSVNSGYVDSGDDAAGSPMSQRASEPPDPSTGDASAEDCWARAVDAKGRPYWYNTATYATSWVPPRPESAPASGPESTKRQRPAPPKRNQSSPAPKGRGSGGGGGSQSSPNPRKKPAPNGSKRQSNAGGGSRQGGPQQHEAPPMPGQVEPVASDPPEVQRIKRETMEQLRSTMTEDLASRKKTFKVLCLKWHPDKNQDNQEVATAIFQFIQEQKDWYTKEEA